MASKFKKYSGNDCETLMYRMYDFIANSGQTAIEFVNGTGSAIALYKQGVGFVTSWASSSDCPDGSYMVIQPATALGSAKWQAKISNTAADSIRCTFACKGGWTNAAQNFGANPVTNDTVWNDAAAPGAGSQVYCGAGTWAVDGSNTGTYCWFNIRDTGSAGADQFLYVGNYTPVDITYDTRPTVMLCRIPTIDGAVSSLGRDSADANCLCRTSIEVAQTTSWTAAGYARIGHTDAPTTPGTKCIMRDLQSKYLPIPAYLYLRNSALMGHFSEHLRICDTTLNDYDTDMAATHIVFGHLWLHYDESL